MNWNHLDEDVLLADINEQSKEKPVVIFKHSTSCMISGMAKNRFERGWKEEYNQTVSPFILDLLSYRSISNKIAEKYGVRHESPQVLVIKNGECIYNASHMSISVNDIISQA